MKKKTLLPLFPSVRSQNSLVCTGEDHSGYSIPHSNYMKLNRRDTGSAGLGSDHGKDHLTNPLFQKNALNSTCYQVDIPSDGFANVVWVMVVFRG